MKFFPVFGVFLLIVANGVFAAPVQVQDISVSIPQGWRIVQDAKDNGTMILSLEHGTDFVAFYARNRPLENMESVFANGSEVIHPQSCLPHFNLNWEMLRTKKMAETRGDKTYYITSFKTEQFGITYFGFARSERDDGGMLAEEFLKGLQLSQNQNASERSLTGPEYHGKKYYLGFGDAHPGPQSMVNEVKYDVQHTHDIFTKEIGGSYIGEKILGGNLQATLLNRWKDLKDKMTNEDMYVQYSSGHGNNSGLMVGVNYNQIRDAVLAMPARELVVFTMACDSGALVKSFNAKKDLWKDFQAKGRTLMVMTSSRAGQPSSTGPGTDPDEPNGPNGSAGSAFGHALWKSLIGYADGSVDGVKDGFISLGEIQKYTTKKTSQIGGHTPVVTGAFSPDLIMNRVPPKEWVDALEHTTEGMSDSQIMERVGALDAELRLR